MDNLYILVIAVRGIGVIGGAGIIGAGGVLYASSTAGSSILPFLGKLQY